MDELTPPPRVVPDYSGSTDGIWSDIGPDGNLILTPVSLMEAHERLMRRGNSWYNEVRVEPRVPPRGRPWKDMRAGACACGCACCAAGGHAIKHPHKCSLLSTFVAYVKISGGFVVKCLRSLLAFGASIVKGLVATGGDFVVKRLRSLLVFGASIVKGLERKLKVKACFVEKPNPASSTVAA